MIRDRLRPAFAGGPAPAAATAPPARFRPPRQRARRLGRMIYLVSVIGFAFYLISTLTGHLIVLNVSGLVTSDRFIVGAAYTARVVETNVAPGDTVRKGDVIARLESTEVLSSIAQLAQNNALIEGRRQGIIKRQQVVEALIPVARRRLETAKEGEARLARDPTGDMTSQGYRSQVLSEAFAAERDLATLESEAASTGGELATIDANVTEVHAAIDKTRQSYADGVIVAPVDGTVSAAVASQVQVLTAGEPVMELLNGETFVLAYLANGRLYDVLPGQRVVITDGVRTLGGRVERIDVVADNLPSDFRSTFGVHERQQVMRVVSDEPMPFPYLSRVSVVSPWSLSHLIARVKGGLSHILWPNGD